MAKASKQIIQQHEEMFYPTVRVRTKKAGGSGTVVYSEKYKDEVYTYIITNQHVIDDSVHMFDWNQASLLQWQITRHLSSDR